MDRQEDGAADLVQEFRVLLGRPDVTERECQEFLELHPEFIYTPFTLNHGFTMGAVVSQFPLGPDLVTDLAYATKCSNFWHVVLIELEHPHAKLFRNDPANVVPAADLTVALSQLNRWREYIRANQDAVTQRIRPLLQPRHMRDNPVLIKYALVIGTNRQAEANPRMRERMATLQTENPDVWVATYDTLISAYESGESGLRRNILRVSEGGFEIKHRHKHIGFLLADLKPGELILMPRQRAELIDEGYDIAAWESGARIDPRTGRVAKPLWGVA